MVVVAGNTCPAEGGSLDVGILVVGSPVEGSPHPGCSRVGVGIVVRSSCLAVRLLGRDRRLGALVVGRLVGPAGC